MAKLDSENTLKLTDELRAILSEYYSSSDKLRVVYRKLRDIDNRHTYTLLEQLKHIANDSQEKCESLKELIRELERVFMESRSCDCCSAFFSNGLSHGQKIKF